MSDQQVIIALNPSAFVELSKLFGVRVIMASPSTPTQGRYGRGPLVPIPCFHAFGYDHCDEPVSIRYAPITENDLLEDGHFHKTGNTLNVKWTKHSKSDLVQLLRDLRVAESSVTKLSRIKSSTLHELSSEGGIADDDDDDDEIITQKTTRKNPKFTYKCTLDVLDLDTQCTVRVQRDGSMFDYIVLINITTTVAKRVAEARELFNDDTDAQVVDAEPTRD